MASESTSNPETQREPPSYWFAACQVGAERALKAEIARLWPTFRFAYSRPGFLTFKLPAGHKLTDDFEPRSVFTRASGFTLGKITASNPAELANQLWAQFGQPDYEVLHVYPRDSLAAGDHGFEPGLTAASREAETLIQQARLATGTSDQPLPPLAQPGQLVLDCVLVETDTWWAGYHRARGESCFPGGFRDLTLPAHAVSRAYLKMAEALAWSELPWRAEDRFAEVGCAPGGASQALLDLGLKVLGIDPAEVDSRLLEHTRFEYLQMRGADVRRREFSDVRWLAADMNVAPNYTLDTVEAIVTHPSVNIDGLLLTLKLLDWQLAAEIPAYIDRIRSWGYPLTRARQLPHNRQEVCVAAKRRIR